MFLVYFQIFLLVIIFGLFSGLVFLPVILSLIGPSDWHASNKDYQMTANHENQLNETDKNTRKNRLKLNNDAVNGTEMISFIDSKDLEENHNDGEIRTLEKC